MADQIDDLVWMDLMNIHDQLKQNKKLNTIPYMDIAIVSAVINW